MDSASAYEKHACDFLRDRDMSSVGAPIAARWARTLSKGADVIEIACGGGYPVTKELAEAGLRLWAVDGAPTLVAVFQSRFPEIPVQCVRVQDADFFGRDYDAAISIGLLFLLSEPDQAALIARIADILVPGGRFLFTAPIEAGAWRDLCTGLECRSLGRDRYEELLINAGFRVLKTYEDEGANNYYEAEKVD
jgi:cyclopropane fatty-acyl-phospholipid synthase-like methyltransferase